MAEVEITESEWMQELDRLRPARHEILTKEEFEFLQYARESVNPIQWIPLSIAFNKKFNRNLSDVTIKGHYNTLKAKKKYENI